MKYLVDAQLPRLLSYKLCEFGYDCVHTLDFPDLNATKDSYINRLSVAEKRIVISKDADFVDSLLVSKKPWKLLHLATGNISNKKLIRLFQDHIEDIDQLFEDNRLINLYESGWMASL